MNKNETIKALANKTQYAQKDVKAVLDAFVETVIETVATGEEVNISGLGKFVSVEVPERTGTIMLGDRKGETYVTPAHKAPKFKFASAFKEAVK